MTDSIPAPERRLGDLRWHALLRAAVAWGLLAAAPSGADLVVLTGGDILKVRSYEVVGERAKLELAAGGRIELSLLRVERVVDDEIEESAVEEPEPPAPLSPFSLRFVPDADTTARPFGAEISAAGQRHDLNPRLIAAVVAAESGYRARAVSNKGARGLMQLMPATALRFDVTPHELFDPARNLEAGARYLRWLLDRYAGRLHLALAAYNAGEGAVDRYAGVPPYRETLRYVRRVYEVFGVTSGR